MNHSWKRYVVLTILAVAVAGASANAQDVIINNQKLRGMIVDQDAQSTRNEFLSILRAWYPPSLLQVLQLDPTLMTNEKYMEAYPKLAEYLKEHPEIIRNSTYYLGRPEEEYRQQFQRSNTERVIEPIAVTTVVLALIGMVTWVIRAAVDHRRWLRMSKLQTEAHTKLMDRFSSNEDLLAFIQTPAGKRFLESSAVPLEPRAIGAPIGRILWSVQAGLVLFAGGIGLEFVSSRIIDEVSEGFYVFGVLVMAVGIGFMLSGIASYLLSRRFGLFDTSATTQGPST